MTVVLRSWSGPDIAAVGHRITAGTRTDVFSAYGSAVIVVAWM